jgi:glycosyltransferase involved in cell wall biosynthesis
MLPRVLARLSRRPDLVLANSQAGRAVHARYGYRPKRWVTLGNGFDTAMFRPDEGARRTVRSELGLDDATPVVGLFARFDPMKDHATFLAAAAALASCAPAPAFLVVGRGTTSAAFEALAGGHESLRGRLIALGERNDVPALMTACDVIVCSSVSEGFPNTIGEAMASGVPCVSTDVGDAGAIIGDAGRLVAKSDPKALATAIGGLLDLASDERQRLGAAARRRIEENFAFGTVVENYRRLLTDVAGR